MERVLLDRQRRLRDRRRRLRRLATRLGDLYEGIERLSLDIRRWQRQIDDVDTYITVRQRWIAEAEVEIARLKSRIEVLEDDYLDLEDEG